MTRREVGEILTFAAAIIPMALPTYWLIFAVYTFPWIVIADSDWSLASRLEHAAYTGLGLVVVSIATILWAAGLFGRGRFAWGIGVVLLAALVLASIWLYSPLENLALPLRGIAHAAGGLAVILGMAGMTLSRKPPRPQPAE